MFIYNDKKLGHFLGNRHNTVIPPTHNISIEVK